MKLNDMIRDSKLPAIHNLYLFGAMVACGMLDLIPLSDDYYWVILLASIIINSVAIHRDAAMLEANGVEAPSTWWFIFVPVYWVKRYRKLRTGGFWAGLVLALVVSFGFSFIGIDNYNEKMIAETACEISTDILKDLDVTCVKATLTNEVADNMWHATVLDSEGDQWRAVVTYNEKTDYIEVNIKNRIF